MGTFADSIRQWIDQDGLVGTCVNPGKWTGGNELLDTGIAIGMEVALNGDAADKDLLQGFSRAIGMCKNANGSFDKNPGRTDQITHDDLKGIACASRIAGMPWAQAIYDWGIKTDWLLSNTGSYYWDAKAKPWDIALYNMCVGQKPFFLTQAFNASVMTDAIWGNTDTRRQTWLAGLALKSYGLVSLRYWSGKMNAVYGNVGALMKGYYGLNHPFCVYGMKLTF